MAQIVNIDIRYGSTTYFSASSNVSSMRPSGETIDSWKRHEGFVTEWAFKVTSNNLHVTDEDTIYVTTSGSYDHTGFEPSYIAGTLYYNRQLIKESPSAILQKALAEAEHQKQQALLAEQQQLQAKTAMLQSPTATWSNQDAYKAEVAETREEIRNYNAEIAAFLATAPDQPGVTDEALLRKPQAQSQPATTPGSDKSNAGKALIIAAGVAAGIALLAIAGGRE